MQRVISLFREPREEDWLAPPRRDEAQEDQQHEPLYFRELLEYLRRHPDERAIEPEQPNPETVEADTDALEARRAPLVTWSPAPRARLLGAVRQGQ